MYFKVKEKPKTFGCIVISSFEEVVWQENMALASHYNPIIHLTNQFDNRWKFRHMWCGWEWCHPIKCPNMPQNIWQEIITVEN